MALNPFTKPFDSQFFKGISKISQRENALLQIQMAKYFITFLKEPEGFEYMVSKVDVQQRTDFINILINLIDKLEGLSFTKTLVRLTLKLIKKLKEKSNPSDFISHYFIPLIFLNFLLRADHLGLGISRPAAFRPLAKISDDLGKAQSKIP